MYFGKEWGPENWKENSGSIEYSTPSKFHLLIVIYSIIPNFLLSGTCEHVTFQSKKDFADVIKVNNLEMEGLLWIIWVGPIKSQEPLKVKNLSQWSEEDMTVKERSKTEMQ